MSSLFIIEAPGKIASFKKMLESYPVRGAVVLATRGHLFAMPDSLTPIGIDKDYNELLLKPKNPDIITAIRDAARHCDTVYVAADPDHEGEVIASDVKKILDDVGPPIVRLKLFGFTTNELRKAFDNMEPVDTSLSSSGVSRRILDRIIGATLSFPPYVYTGRVKASIIEFLMKKSPVIGYVEGFLPSEDGKGFRTSIPITRDSAGKAERIVETLNSKATVAKSGPRKIITVTPPKNWDCAKAVSQVSSLTEIPISEVMGYMQELYEQRRMSYPRSDSQRLSADGRKVIKVIAGNAGLNYSLPENCEILEGEQGAHESPHPLETDLDITTDIRMLSDADAVLTAIARNHVLAGTKGIKAFVTKPDLSTLDPSLRNLPWQQAEYANLPWEAKEKSVEQTSVFIRKDQERVVLDAMSEAGIGRPSTYINHVKSFLEKGLVDRNFNLSDTGIITYQVIDSTEPEFFRGGAKAMLETVFGDNSLSTKEKIEKVMSRMPSLREDFQAKADSSGKSSLEKEFSFLP